MRTHAQDVRCKDCGILLAKVDETGFTIRRGELEANFDGSFRASIRCYRRSCRSLNVLKLSTATALGGAAA